MAAPVIIRRTEDMSPTGSLELYLQDDGDIIVTVRAVRDDGLIAVGESVEFCNSGGHSPQTLAALRMLMVAMQSDANYDAARERRPQPVASDEPFPHDDPPWTVRRQKALNAAISEALCHRCNRSGGDACVVTDGPNRGVETKQWHSSRVRQAHWNLGAARKELKDEATDGR